MKTIKKIEDLIGEEISAVSFVRDYVEFHFDGPVLRSISNPFVKSRATERRFPESGSRDALCCLIGSVVLSVKLEKHRALELATNNDCRITIPLDPESSRGHEAMHFVPGSNQPVQVW
jgi:hypothetical protein